MKKITTILLSLLLVLSLLVSCAPEVPGEDCEHVWGMWQVTTQPTLESEGEMTRTCNLCGHSESAVVDKLQPSPCTHTWGDWVETKAPTTEAVGEESRTCTLCGESETREVAKLEPTPEPSHTYTDFTEAEKAIIQEYFGLVIPFLPTDEYYVDNDYDESFGNYINYYTIGNTQGEYEAYLEGLSDWTLTETYEDLFGDIWYCYTLGKVSMDICLYQSYADESETTLVNYVDIYLYQTPEETPDPDPDPDPNPDTEHTYTDFTAEEKALMQSVTGTTIPFLPNDEYYVEEYTLDDGEHGVNFYTFGNTQTEFDIYKILFATWSYDGTDVDEYGDTWYFFSKGEVYVDMTYYYYEGNYVFDLYIYLATESGGTGGSGDSGNSGSGSDTPADGSTLTIPEAVALGNSYTQNTFSSSKYYVTGEVVSIANTTYGNMTIKDANGNTLYIYGVYSADGETRYDALSNKPVVGDTVTLYGVIGNYNGAQMKSGWLISMSSGGGSTTPDPEPTPSGSASLDFSNSANRVSWDENSQLWQANGITVTNNKDGASSPVADYTNPARFYNNSTLIVAYDGMTKIVFHCSSPSYANALASAIGSSASVSGSDVTVTFASATDSFSVVLSGGQVRLDSIEVIGEGGSTGGSGTTPDPDPNPNPGTEHTYTDFTAEEKALMQSVTGTTIPFLPNDEYYVEEYTLDDGEHGVNFYTFGNTQTEFDIYKILFATWSYDGTDVDEYGDTWYFFSKGEVYVDMTYYYYEGNYVFDLYIYLAAESGGTGGSGDSGNSGSTGGSTTNPDNLITNDGKGLPTDSDGVYDVNLDDATYTKDVTEQGYYIDGCPTTGSPAVLVIPVEFSDVTAASKGYDLNVLEEAFKQGGNVDYFSLYDYYYLSSYGKLTLDIDVLDSWFRPQYDSSYYANATMEYYGSETAIGEQLILDEALAYLSTFMDLSRYDSDGNGVIDAVVLINTLDIDSNSDFQWAFRYWNIYTDSEGYYYEYDGVSANDYLWASFDFLYESYDSEGNTIYTDTSVRNTYTYIHEFGHVLGADDYYDTSYVGAPMDGCDIMDSMCGDHNPFTKFHFGWLRNSRLVVAEDSITLTLEAFSKNGDTIIIANNWDPMLGAYQEYYILIYYTASTLNDGEDYGYFARDGVVVYHVNASLKSEVSGGDTYYDVYNNNTDASDSYGTPNNLIELVKSANDTYTYVVGDTIPTVTLDNGETLLFTFVVDALTEDTATITFSR